MPINTLLYIVAFILFIFAAIPIPTNGLRLEWFGVAALVLTLIV